MKKSLGLLLLVTLILLLMTFNILVIRLLNFRELDDLHPSINCTEELIDKSDILWVIPKYNNIAISENQEWCNQILSLNKTLGLHGVYHTPTEFQFKRNQSYLDEGITIFESCFGFKPTLFKPPQLAISNSNKKLIENNSMVVKAKFNQFTHKVYHCEDSGDFSNRLIDLF